MTMATMEETGVQNNDEFPHEQKKPCSANYTAMEDVPWRWTFWGFLLLEREMIIMQDSALCCFANPQCNCNSAVNPWANSQQQEMTKVTPRTTMTRLTATYNNIYNNRSKTKQKEDVLLPLLTIAMSCIVGGFGAALHLKDRIHLQKQGGIRSPPLHLNAVSGDGGCGSPWLIWWLLPVIEYAFGVVMISVIDSGGQKMMLCCYNHDFVS